VSTSAQRCSQKDPVGFEPATFRLASRCLTTRSPYIDASTLNLNVSRFVNVSASAPREVLYIIELGPNCKALSYYIYFRNTS